MMMKLKESKIIDPPSFQKNSLEQLKFIPGIWTNGKVYWLQQSNEKIIKEEELVIKVKQEHIHSKINLSSVYVSNHSNETKEIKFLAQHHYTNVSQEQFTFVSPKENLIFHLAGGKFFLVNGGCDGKGIQDSTIQPYWRIYIDQIWSSIQKGNLQYQPMSKGPAVSIFTLKTTIEPRETKKINSWAICGANKNEVFSLNQALLKNN